MRSEVVEITSTLNPRAVRAGGLWVVVAVISIAWTWTMSDTSAELVYMLTLEGKWWRVHYAKFAACPRHGHP
jgi:hypothetical protein